MGVPTDYDCVIVGGGMVGAVLACALADQPLRIAVVEAVAWRSTQQPSYDDRGLALSPVSQRILQTLGVWDALAPHATPIEHVHVSDQGHFGMTRLDAAALGVPFLGQVVVARALGQCLMDRMTRETRLDLLCPASVRGLSVQPDTVAIDLHEEAGTRRIHARLLVGADGGGSRVRELLGIAATTHDYRQTAIVANLGLADPHHNTAYERFTRNGPIALLPLSGQRCVSVWAMQCGEAAGYTTLDADVYLQRLRESLGRRLAPFTELGSRRGYPLQLTQAQRFAGPRWVLVGNAAHSIHPNAAQGLNLGLRDVAGLAEQLSNACRRGEDPGGEPVLRHYTESRRADQRRVVGFTDTLACAFCSEFFPTVAARGLALLAVDLLPPLKTLLMRHGMGLYAAQARLARGLTL